MQSHQPHSQTGRLLHLDASVFIEKHWVYVLQSSVDPNRHYVGLTSDVDNRVRFHNDGRSPHTAKDAPWRILVALHFERWQSAAAFERYLKSGSGRAFARRHFV